VRRVRLLLFFFFLRFRRILRVIPRDETISDVATTSSGSREETAEWNARVRVKRVEVDASREEVREVRVARFLFREKARRGISLSLSLSPVVSAAAHFFPSSRKCNALRGKRRGSSEGCAWKRVARVAGELHRSKNAWMIVRILRNAVVSRGSNVGDEALFSA